MHFQSLLHQLHLLTLRKNNNKKTIVTLFRPKLNIIAFSSWRRGSLMVSALDSGSSGLGSSLGRGHCVVFLGKTLYSHSASLHPGV